MCIHTTCLVMQVRVRGRSSELKGILSVSGRPEQ